MSLTRGGDWDELYHLQIGVRSCDIAPAERRPVSLTLSLDTSGSMGGEPIARVRDTCRAIAGSLTAGDVISIVEWSNSQTVILDSLEGDAITAYADALDELEELSGQQALDLIDIVLHSPVRADVAAAFHSPKML